MSEFDLSLFHLGIKRLTYTDVLVTSDLNHTMMELIKMHIRTNRLLPFLLAEHISSRVAFSGAVTTEY